ncbi:30S ribosomal protein S9 [Pelolinea submarina]|uniref:Small ribosomal subunit protein uS9 n=1 Tax=Pelolinea submarina TaxID=913107 RepID=A0A347ZVA1_9CHLR|nr:30S ribosomal protein S9 [Pelolinea submarina]REG10182.1 SSU ribosomal protein S9P [Pelolinea submarina]BBB49232.1 small subunit ribosomal protein S9 [Pelolinea submarina]
MSGQYYEGVGRRKESTARVRIMQGDGKFIVNDKSLNDYFTRLGDAEAIMAPFGAVGENQVQYDVTVLVNGGGVTGQTTAVQLGLARAFTKMNPDYVTLLRRENLLTRDPRVKERKKPGLKRARKAPTYTKR